MKITDLAQFLGNACYGFLALNFLWGLQLKLHLSRPNLIFQRLNTSLFPVDLHK